MQIKDIFLNKKKNRFATIPIMQPEQKTAIPDGMWCKCDACKKIVYNKDLLQNLQCCPSCGHHFRMKTADRLAMICDDNTYIPLTDTITRNNPLDFPGYESKLEKNAEASGLEEAVACVHTTVGGNETIVCVMDSHFMMGSMGYAVGEKITLAIEYAIQNTLPILIFTASGGARMQEGMVSLMQMAKVSGALAKLSEAGLLYVTILTDPTTGGVTASFAMLGDIILAEKGALVGFAGKRVIEQTINQKLPEGFQTAEFMLEKGFVDHVIERNHLKEMLSQILTMHAGGATPC
ncbi:MAG: acetyl-CoA carboxylase carboxyltransferase subunit beta [Hyphomonadaceae bacterium]|nr:acetyl-CoA carboxylase carboxyltransferase subunit beta [Clostridia bacterium]